MAPRGTCPAACAAGAVGATLGWLGGSGALTLAGLDVLGPMVAALGGAAVGASVGVVAGAFVGLGLTAFEQRQDRRRMHASYQLQRMRVRCALDAEDARSDAASERERARGMRTAAALTG